jgi:hypothetical protein
MQDFNQNVIMHFCDIIDSLFLHPTEHSSSTASLFALCFSLHLLAHFDVDFEELGDAAVEADRFALVEVGFAVGCVDAF